MSLYGSDDYEPSQLDNLATSTGWESPPVRRSTRVSTAGGRNNSSTLEARSILRQQTPSMWMHCMCRMGWTQTVLQIRRTLECRPTAVVAAHAILQVSPIAFGSMHSDHAFLHIPESLQGCRTCDSLRAQLEIMQAAYNALEERLEQACGILSDPIDVLDPTEQSQVILNLQDFRCTGDASDWYPSSASYGGCEGGILGRSRRRIQEGAEDACMFTTSVFMSGFRRVKDFEIDGGNGRCKLCSTKWMKLGNLRAHEAQKGHQENVARELVLEEEHRVAQSRVHNATQSESPGPCSASDFSGAYRQATVEDCTEEDDAAFSWYESRPWREHAQSTFDAQDRESDISADLRAALDGRVEFTTGEGFAIPGLSEVTLEDVLGGAGLFEVISGDEEWPAMDISSGVPSDGEVEGYIPTAEEMSDTVFGTRGARESFFPYPDHGMMRTDILFSSPHLKFSRAQQEAILAWGKAMGGRDIPSLYRLDKFQREALEAVGNPTVKVGTASGNVFYMNSIREILRKHYAHPETRRKIRKYPEFTGARVSEVWHSEKWLVDAPDAILTPMIRHQGQDYYVNELAACAGGRWFIPTRFFEMNGEMWAKGHAASSTPAGILVNEEPSVCPCKNFEASWPQVEKRSNGSVPFSVTSSKYAAAMPNPDRAIAAGLEWECLPLIVFIDDVSGNTSKQWNVHYSSYMSNGGLPRADLEKDGNIHFVATSPHASPMEIIEAVCDEFKKAGGSTPIRAWDSVNNRYVLVRPWLLFLPGDNPMQAELCSHIGLKGNFFCRCCHAGGDQKFKASDEGYPSLMVVGAPRSPEETREAILQQLTMATRAAAEKPLKEMITTTGVKDSFAMPIINRLLTKGKLLRKTTSARKGLSPEDVNAQLYADLMRKKDLTVMNPLLLMPGFNVHKDTPVEPLHTHLLGIVKYFWAQTVWVLEKRSCFDEFQARLNSLARSGLKIPNIMADYMCRYRGSLIGKHFKTISQIMAFAVNGLVDEVLEQCWLAIGRLTVLIWEAEIQDIKTYVVDLRAAINEVLDFAAAMSPGLITEKNKFHILLHLPDHVLRFGSSLLFSTERYESFNHIFRLCSIHSNRQAPSRDIANAFAHQERCRHVLTGGYWLDKSSQRWAPIMFASVLDLLISDSPREHPSWVVVRISRLGDTPHCKLKMPTLFRDGSVHLVRGEQPELRLSRKSEKHKDNVHYVINTLTLHNQHFLRMAVPAALLKYHSYFADRHAIHKHAAESLRDNKLQKKLAREALIRKNAEAALRAINPAAAADILGLDGETIPSTEVSSPDEDGRTPPEEDDSTLSPDLSAPHATVSIDTTSADTHVNVANPMEVPVLDVDTVADAAEGVVEGRKEGRAGVDEAEEVVVADIVSHCQTDQLQNSITTMSHEHPMPAIECTHRRPTRLPPQAVSHCDTPPDLTQTAPDVLFGAPSPATIPSRQPLLRAGMEQLIAQFNYTAQGTMQEPPSGSEFNLQQPMPVTTSISGNTFSFPVTTTPGPSTANMSGAQTEDGELLLNDIQGDGTTSTSGATTRMSTPYNSNRIHGRDDDDDGDFGAPPRLRVPGQLLRSVTQEKAQKQGLTAEQISDTLDFCELSPVAMLINLKIHLFKNENELLRRFLRIFVRHPDFATRLKSFVAAALLAPVAPAYLDQVYTSLALHLEKNVESLLGLSPSCRRDPADWMLVKSALVDALSQERSAMKRKIDLAVRNKQDIYSFTQSMMSHDVRPKQAHWGRFAFLRNCAFIVKEEKIKMGYWKFVDMKLKQVRLTARTASPESEAGRKLSETTFFATILSRDIVRYPIKSGAVAKQTYTNEGVTELQASIERVVGRIVLDDSVIRPDDAPVEEDGEEQS
ncbi:hypothetical protein C8T65DRAFT_731047 [Cerioporus squamosus]|nr:hypothetical protein C8T65DRAFT_731047 [Cerioporus squamosus]